MNKYKIAGYFTIGIILVSSGLTVASIFGYRNWLGDTIATGLGFDLTGQQITGEARVNAAVTVRGNASAYPSATVLAWFDWDGDGAVDRGSVFEGLGGEIESLSASAAAGFTTTKYYPVGSTVFFQVSATGYETAIYPRVVSGTPDADGIVTLGSIPLMLLDTSITVTISEADAGTLTTGTGDYNYTTYGTTVDLTVRVACGTSNAGIGVSDYVNWVSGYAYKGSFIGITLDVADASGLVFTTAYSGYKQVGSYVFVWWNVNDIFNDGSINDDGTFDLNIKGSIVSAFDMNTIGIYDSMLQQEFDQCAWGSADGSETDIDFTA
jgi:hypothetical protein